MNDDELLDLLSGALASTSLQPRDSDLARFHETLRAARVSPRRRWWRRSAVSVAVGTGLLVSPAVAWAVTGDVPGPVRSAIHALGVPIESRELHETKQAMVRLRDALEGRDRDTVRDSSSELRDRLATLDDADSRRVQPAANQLLAEADRFLAVDDSGTIPDPTGSVTSDPSATTAPGNTTATTPDTTSDDGDHDADDGDGDRGSGDSDHDAGDDDHDAGDTDHDAGDGDDEGDDSDASGPPTTGDDDPDGDESGGDGGGNSDDESDDD